MIYKKPEPARESFLRNKTESDALSISKIEHRKAVSLRQNCDTFLSGDDSLRKEKKMSYQNSAHARIRQYSLPQLSTGKCWYITFNAFDPEIGKMRRKRLRVSPKIKKTADRRRYAQDVMQRLTEQLQNGWNPWICYQSPDTFTSWADACDNYRSTLGRLKADGCLKEKTIYGYLRMLDAFCSWARSCITPSSLTAACSAVSLTGSGWIRDVPYVPGIITSPGSRYSASGCSARNI